MARAIVTEEAVAEVAQQLADAGEEPSIIRVQAVIGGGSFSTVKKHLDAWKAQRQVAAAAPVVAPSEIMQRAAEFGRLLWQEASLLAAQEVQRVREEARRQVEEARGRRLKSRRKIARSEVDDASLGHPGLKRLSQKWPQIGSSESWKPVSQRRRIQTREPRD